MGRAPCCDKENVKRGPWSPEEDEKLKEFIDKYGNGGNWIALPQKAGLKRCGKSCRLRWLNYLRPNIKHGEFSDDEDRVICSLYASIGSRWSIIAAQLPGRTDNDIKNYWNTKLKKKLIGMVPSPQPKLASQSPSSSLYHKSFTSYYTPINPVTTLEPSFLNPPYLLNNNINSITASLAPNYPLLPTQESLWSPMPYYPSVKDALLMFGGEASCSSSDGSCKQEEMNFQSYTSNGLEENQTFMLDGYFGNNAQLQYDLEEVKQLISSNDGYNNNSYFFNDENKTNEREMYFHW